jgi:hypothetical protein
MRYKSLDLCCTGPQQGRHDFAALGYVRQSGVERGSPATMRELPLLAA